MLQEKLIGDQEKLVSLHERFHEQCNELHRVNRLILERESEILKMKAENGRLKDQSRCTDLIEFDTTNTIEQHHNYVQQDQDHATNGLESLPVPSQAQSVQMPSVSVPMVFNGVQ